MTIKFEKIQRGMTLWTTERRRMGNTPRRETVAIPHLVTDVLQDRITAMRNGRSTVIYRRRAERMRASDPTCRECRKVGRHDRTCTKSKLATPAEPER